MYSIASLPDIPHKNLLFSHKDTHFSFILFEKLQFFIGNRWYAILIHTYTLTYTHTHTHTDTTRITLPYFTLLYCMVHGPMDGHVYHMLSLLKTWRSSIYIQYRIINCNSLPVFSIPILYSVHCTYIYVPMTWNGTKTNKGELFILFQCFAKMYHDCSVFTRVEWF